MLLPMMREVRDQLRPDATSLGLKIEDVRIRRTDLTQEVWFYLRGEEYSAQIDHFVKRIRDREIKGINDFSSALETDRAVAMIHGTHGPAPSAPVPRRSGGFFDRLLRGLSGKGN